VYELVLHPAALHLKEDHAVCFTEVHINFSVLASVMLGSLVKQSSSRAKSQSYRLL